MSWELLTGICSFQTLLATHHDVLFAGNMDKEADAEYTCVRQTPDGHGLLNDWLIPVIEPRALGPSAGSSNQAAAYAFASIDNPRFSY